MILTDDEAALLAAHRKAAGHEAPEQIHLETYNHFLSVLMRRYQDAMVNHIVKQSSISARLLLVDKMVKVQEAV
jgi:hypothetical protein